MKGCNKCANIRCDIIRSGWPVFRNNHPVKTQDMQLTCRRQMKPEPFKVTVFERLLVRQPRETVELLARMSLRFVEVKQRPFFTLLETS